MTALSPASVPPGALTANLICMASMLVWAVGLPAADLLIPLIPPVPLTALRAGLAAVFLLLLWWLAEGSETIRRANWGRAIVVGGICMGLGAVLLVIAQARTDAVTVAIITAMAPVVGIALECLLDRRQITRRLILGLGLSLAGGYLAYAAGKGAVVLGLGAIAAFGSVVAFTWGSRATVTAFPLLTPLGRTAITVSGAAICAGGAAGVQALMGGPVPQWAAMGMREWGALALFGIGSMAISQVLWIVSVGRLGIGLSSLHMNAVPFYVMLIVFALGGAWSWPQAGGAVVVVLGVMIAQSRARS